MMPVGPGPETCQSLTGRDEVGQVHHHICAAILAGELESLTGVFFSSSPRVWSSLGLLFCQ